MLRTRLCVAAFMAGALLAPVVRAAGPVYSLASVVNSATGVSGDFAPNSLVTIYGTNLSFGTSSASAAQYLPRVLAEVQVNINGLPADLFYVSPQQINFLVPSILTPGPVKIQVVRQGVTGPLVTIILNETAPGFFALGSGNVIATHADGRLLGEDSPAAPEEVVVIYAAGLGHTNPDSEPGLAPTRAASIVLLSRLSVLLGGNTVDPSRILYAGVTPGFAGLYQINLKVPSTAASNPEIRVFIGMQGSPSFLKLPLRIQ